MTVQYGGAAACAALRLRRVLSERLGVAPEQAKPTRVGYELRKLIGKGLLRKAHGCNRYTLTDLGYRAVLFLVKTHQRLLGPGLDALDESVRACLPASTHDLDRALHRLNAQFDALAAQCGLDLAA